MQSENEDVMKMFQEKDQTIQGILLWGTHLLQFKDLESEKIILNEMISTLREVEIANLKNKNDDLTQMKTELKTEITNLRDVEIVKLELEKEDLNRHLNEKDQIARNLESDKKELEEEIANLKNVVIIQLQQENEENYKIRLEHEKLAKGTPSCHILDKLTLCRVRY